MEEQLKRGLKSLKLNESMISTILGGVIVLVIGIMVFNYFSSLQEEGEVTGEALVEVSPEPGEPEIVEENGKKVPQGLPITYKVKAGDDLWSIAEQYYNSGYNWVDIAAENNLVNANLIDEGQELSLPKVEVKQATVQKDAELMMAEEERIDGEGYTTQTGDYLWDVAVRAYGDGYQWGRIYEANKEVVGPNPSLIEKGMELVIPRGSEGF